MTILQFSYRLFLFQGTSAFCPYAGIPKRVTLTCCESSDCHCTVLSVTICSEMWTLIVMAICSYCGELHTRTHFGEYGSMSWRKGL